MYLSISSVCRQVDGQSHDLEVDLFLARVQDHPHHDRDAVRVGEHALHLVFQTQVVENAANRILDFRICHQVDQFRQHAGHDHAGSVVGVERKIQQQTNGRIGQIWKRVLNRFHCCLSRIVKMDLNLHTIQQTN